MGISTVATSVLATILLGSVTAFAGPPCDEALVFLQPPPPLEHPCDVPPPPPPGCGRMHPLLQHEGYGMPSGHHLPPELREQVGKLLQAEQAGLEPLMQKLHENRRALLAVADQQPLDEKALTALADEQGKLQAALLVARVRTHSRIRLLLDQAKPAEKPAKR